MNLTNGTATAIIPARGGSKGVLRKNLRLLGGQPLIAHTIAAARGSGLFERVIVSTDDSEIAGVAAGLGAEVPFLRPAELATDEAPGSAPVLHALQWLQRTEGFLPTWGTDASRDRSMTPGSLRERTSREKHEGVRSLQTAPARTSRILCDAGDEAHRHPERPAPQTRMLRCVASYTTGSESGHARNVPPAAM